jgi:hypothetical protein
MQVITLTNAQIYRVQFTLSRNLHPERKIQCKKWL